VCPEIQIPKMLMSMATKTEIERYWRATLFSISKISLSESMYVLPPHRIRAAEIMKNGRESPLNSLFSMYESMSSPN